MAWGVDEVDEEARTVLALLDEVQVVLRQFIEEGDGAAGETGKSAQLRPLPPEPKHSHLSPCTGAAGTLRVQLSTGAKGGDRDGPRTPPRSPLTWT